MGNDPQGLLCFHILALFCVPKCVYHKHESAESSNAAGHLQIVYGYTEDLKSQITGVFDKECSDCLAEKDKQIAHECIKTEVGGSVCLRKMQVEEVVLYHRNTGGEQMTNNDCDKIEILCFSGNEHVADICD